MSATMDDGIAIRPYREDDFDAVAGIWCDSWNATAVGTTHPVALDYLRERLPQEIARGWSLHVATAGPTVVGFLALHGDILEQLFIAPGMQRRGIGTRFLNLAKAQAPKGFRLTTAVDNSQSCRFYAREGLRRGEVSVHRGFGHQIVRFDWP